MSLDDGLLKFYEEFQLSIITRSEIIGEECFREDQFTDLMLEYIGESAEISNGIILSHRASGIQFNGYNLNDEEDCLDLFVSIYNADSVPTNLWKSEVEVAFKRLTNFLEKTFKAYYLKLEESTELFDCTHLIYNIKLNLYRVRLFLFTDGIVKVEAIENSEVNGIEISYHIWDIQRVYRLWSSGKEREIIEIDFTSFISLPVRCLPMPLLNNDYRTFLAFFPAKLLIDIYHSYGTRLLERNVRAFLQARGTVNKGIRETILKQPHMFLAFNNGISATAEAVIVETLEDGSSGLKLAKDFQIVNGGQTTASLYQAYKKDKANVSDILIQVKLTVISQPEMMNEIVPQISKFANSQNKINVADFSANDPFHRKIEELSRTVWAPARDGSQRNTHWFYERARGQYMDEKNRELTPSRKKEFEAKNPPKQQFTKTDLAKFVNTWEQLPHFVSRGAQKNFLLFTYSLEAKESSIFTQKDFENLIALAILFKEAEKIVQSQKFGGYRANIVTYTLAWLSQKSNKRLDLSSIWRKQSISPTIREAITEVSKTTHTYIINPPNGRNVTEWCKKEECWINFKDFNTPLSDSFYNELLDSQSSLDNSSKGIVTINVEDQQNITRVLEIPGQTWFKISVWAKETNNFEPWQRSLAYGLGQLISRGKQPTVKQAKQGLKILEHAKSLGFIIN